MRLRRDGGGVRVRTRAVWAAALTYYWGLTLTIQGIITPSLAQNFPDPRFFGFWALHCLVVWSALFLTFGIDVRPTWRTYRIAVGLTTGWAIAVYVFNVVVGTNYGYLNHKPPSADPGLLGPWPAYVGAEIVIVCVVGPDDVAGRKPLLQNGAVAGVLDRRRHRSSSRPA